MHTLGINPCCLKISDPFQFLIPGVKKNWTDARNFCRKLGGDLVSIHSEVENEKIRNIRQLYSSTMDIWIGLNDTKVENHFTWSDGTQLDYENWSKREPNNAGPGEDCTVIYYGVRPWPSLFEEKRWNDEKCEKKFYFICKYKGTFIGSLFAYDTKLI